MMKVRKFNPKLLAPPSAKNQSKKKKIKDHVKVWIFFSIHPHTFLFHSTAKYREKGKFMQHEKMKLQSLMKVLKELEMWILHI